MIVTKYKKIIKYLFYMQHCTNIAYTLNAYINVEFLRQWKWVSSKIIYFISYINDPILGILNNVVKYGSLILKNKC